MPSKLQRLPELAYNVWWSWNAEARDIFRRLDYPLWRRTQHNPVRVLRLVSEQTLLARAQDASFLRRYNKVMMDYDRAMENGHSWFHVTYPQLTQKTIAYFSFEFGLHSSLPIYSGGLGILAGDHAKEASDLGLPFVGVGFLYPQGYFRQHVPSHGWQEAVYEPIDYTNVPILPVRRDDGQEMRISVPMDSRVVHARIWRVQVGRVPLFLMDTDVPENAPWDRELSARLYSGDNEMRIRQEIMLGVGGVRLLDLLGYDPAVLHMNEGHSAFLLLETIRRGVAEGLSFAEAAERTKAQTIFTTHTPVPAGHDVFPFHLMDKYFYGFWERLGITREEFLALGWHAEPWGEAFNMTVLALRLAGQFNGVSKLHGKVSRQMWQHIWPGRTEDEVPITSVTNGVHVPGWTAGEMRYIFNKYLGADWEEHHDDPVLWERLADVPDEELWRVHVTLKAKLMSYLRSRARRAWVDGMCDPTEVLVGGTLLDPDALTIGFARRFATYKRASLLFTDMDRLQNILLNMHRPVQVIFAGKAHPADEPGKQLIQQVYMMAKANQFGGRVAFVEDYDMHSARYFKQGVDVWLNTPRRPREASGTSGMKASLNGIPNLSILDGWWVEGYNGANGWCIEDREYAGTEEQDYNDAQALYRILEEEVVPLYYTQDRDGVPRGWVEIMREAIRSNAWRFSTRRMVKEYTTELYLKAMLGEPVAEPA
ncbi:MAG: alpha-glucan family phosphorylase [Candidatus Promineofilum sp.]|nr:alpha-glucan family phosphorylase [Promineifilum sp.]MBP9656328.1 alpha-glucan family phosphorylase [Promineifilum sp.]